jgi:uncharacterized protein with PIN domain
LILYLDTSALVKLYAEEVGTETVEQTVGEAEAVATSVVTYAEAQATLSRKLSEKVFSRGSDLATYLPLVALVTAKRRRPGLYFANAANNRFNKRQGADIQARSLDL